MKALSILQPWAFAIIHLGKDIENRTWVTGFRGRFLIHAGKGFDAEGYDFIRALLPLLPVQVTLPKPHEFQRGGIVGSAVIRDVVRASDSRWFFTPLRGQLGFFEAEKKILLGEG
jgi:hypothetical protein